MKKKKKMKKRKKNLAKHRNKKPGGLTNKMFVRHGVIVC